MTMSKREIIRSLLNKEIPERMGLNESFWPHIVENSWGEQGIGAGADFVGEFDLDVRSVHWFYIGHPRPDLIKTIEETEEWKLSQDGWGARLKWWKHKAGTPEHVGFTIDGPEMWKREFRDAALAINPREFIDPAAAKRKLDEAAAGERFVTIESLLQFEHLRSILGDAYMLEALILEPEFIHDFNSVITDKLIHAYDLYFTDVGTPDGVHVYEDLGYTASAFCGPRLHREMIYPYHKKLFNFFKDHGMPIIFHTCGDFRVHIDAIVEAGADCIQAMEAKTGMNVVDLAKRYKDKLCFMGNIDIRALESGDRNRIKNEMLGKLAGMRELRAPYIFMSDHSIPPSVTVADYRYALELYWKNCRY